MVHKLEDVLQTLVLVTLAKKEDCVLDKLIKSHTWRSRELVGLDDPANHAVHGRASFVESILLEVLLHLDGLEHREIVALKLLEGIPDHLNDLLRHLDSTVLDIESKVYLLGHS